MATRPSGLAPGQGISSGTVLPGGSAGPHRAAPDRRHTGKLFLRPVVEEMVSLEIVNLNYVRSTLLVEAFNHNQN